MKQSFTTFGVGGGWDNGEDIIIDAAFTFGTAGGENTEVDAATPANDFKEEWDKGTAIDFAARMFWEAKDDVTIVPVFDFGTADYSTKVSVDGVDVPLSPGNGSKVSGFMLGAAADIEVNSNNLLIFALEFNSMKWERDESVASEK